MNVIRLSKNRINEVVNLANRVFRTEGGSMLKDYPLLFSEENAHNILCVEEDGKIVSIVGLLFRDIQIFSVKIKVSLIGSVCTDEKYRRKGYSTILMNEAGKISIENGASLMLISGDNSVYKRFGAVNAGIYFAHPVLGNASVKYRRATVKDIELLAHLHSMDPVRFIRYKKIFKIMIETSMAIDRPADIFISNSAYVVITKSAFEGDQRYYCVEYGGCQIDIAELVKSVTETFEPLIIYTKLSDCVLNKIFQSKDSQKREFMGSIKILDKVSFFSQIKPYLEEQMLGEVKIEDLSQLTRYIFGAPNKEKTMKWPLPLPDYGMDYV